MAEQPPKENAIPLAAAKPPTLAAPGAPQRPRFIGQKIIKTRFQFKFAFSILIFLAIAATIVWAQGRMAVSNMIASGAVSDPLAIDQLKLLNSIVGRTIVLGLAVTFGLALFFSHYIAGPLYRFEKILQEMGKGNLTVSARLRKNDELQDTADEFNRALAGLRSKVKIERDAVAGIIGKARAIAVDLRASGRPDEAARLDAALTELETLPPQFRI